MEAAAEARGPRPRAPTSTSGSRSARPTRTRATTTAPGSTTTPATSVSASSCPTTPCAFELRHEEIAEVFSREFLEQHAGAGLRVAGSDLHRRPAALGLDADRADPREPQPGRGHRRAADTEADRATRSVAIAAISSEYPGAVRELRGQGLPRLRQAIHRRDARIPRRPAGRASPTSCRTTSRTSASLT